MEKNTYITLSNGQKIPSLALGTWQLWSTFNQPGKVEDGFMLSLKALQLDYIDLYLMHTPTAVKYIDDKTLMPPAEDGGPGFALEDVHYIDTWKVHIIEGISC
ncbi:hypothetical protein BSL78_15681 [Apostichopus japonicus]|uniref:NADP-dependent oxidoreductase domain-containing protein n=1 Tax=Stichopus japonicus TaxID=307972 RepID=A0A2G8KHH9_STIJA|nr:hypothetical protein BSL78_15681 [Apostichopus japonicus]